MALWLLTGDARAQTAPVNAPVVVVQIAPVSVASVPEARQLADGTQACVQQINQQGGVRGRRLQWSVVDDELNAARVPQALQAAMAKQPLALVNLMGSALMGQMLESRWLDRHDVVVLGVIPGAEAFRTPGHARLFHIRSGDRVHLARLLQHSRTLGVQRLHVLYQDVGIGQSGAAELQRLATQLGGLQISTSVSGLDPASQKRAVQAAVASGAQTHVVLGFPHYMAEMLAQLRQAGVVQPVFALGYLSPALAMAKAGQTGAHGLGLTQAMPNPNGQVLGLQRSFQQAMRSAFPALTDYTTFHLEGCVGVRVLAAALQRVEGTPTAAALAKALHTMGEVDLGGYRVNFGGGQVGNQWSDMGVMSATGRLLF